jgi:phosphate transport system protein
MTRAVFERRLQALQDSVLTLGSMVEKAIDRALDALKRRDLEASQQVVDNDTLIDQKRYEIEEECIDLIATQQPMARDLRTIVAVLNIIVDLERMGDHAEGIGKISLMMSNEPLLKPLIDIPRMAQKTNDMLRRSLAAFVERDVEAAKQISSEDDEVDNLYDQVYRELLLFMLQDPKTITRATWLLWVAHNLERIADRVTNICERVVFLVTGKVQEMNVSKY